MTHAITSHMQSVANNDFAQAYFFEVGELEASRRFTAEQLEVIYAMGYADITQKKWDSALCIFSFLSLYGATRRHYLAGLATCLQMLGRWDEAIDIWSLVLTLFDDSLEPMLQIAYCQLAAGQRDVAVTSLRQLDQALDEVDTLKPRVTALLEQLESADK